MSAEVVLSLLAAACSLGLGLLVLWRHQWSVANLAFVAGMVVLAAHEIPTAAAARTLLAAEALEWQRLRLAVGALSPGLWLVFSVSFARANSAEFLRKWRWTILATFALPLSLTVFGRDLLFVEALLDGASRWNLRLGPAGYALHVVFLFSAVLILMNLESTLRGSTGTSRWQLKFTLLGVGVLFAVQVYTHSQALLYSSFSANLSSVSSTALVLASLLILVSLLRSRVTPVDVYLSQSLLYGSITVLLVGVYLVAVGGLAKIATLLGRGQSLPLAAFLVLVSLVALAVILLSGEAQEKLKLFVSRHLQRPKHDYRNVWTAFTQRTSSLLDARPLCSAMARMVSETFGSPSVSIWLVDETKGELALGGSTALTEERSEALLATVSGGSPLVARLRDPYPPIDLHAPGGREAPGGEPIKETFLHEAGIRYCAPLVAGREILGVMTLNDRVTREPFSTEDFDLLKTLADQAAAGLLNLKLSEKLVRAREMEAFQNLSAFFVHDLKNLASRLSLTMQNLPEHYDDPDFREDLFRIMRQSVERIQSMCGRLSPLSKELEVHRRETDLNELVRGAVASLDGSIRAAVVQDLQPLPVLDVDPELIQKVLVNLILNASEAIGNHGEIRVASRQREGWAEISVRDNGCGMSRDFIVRSLFKPFQTTKKNGLGIGLYHSKKIIEAHRGRLEVESEVGKGSTFFVLLPTPEKDGG